MRKLTIVLLLASTAPTFAAKQVTPDQLDQLLIHARSSPDAKLAKQLFALELTERVSSSRLAGWEGEMPGPRARQALVALADASAFLGLPQEEIPVIPAPDSATQDSLLALARNYVADTIPKLPNFFATRNTSLFSDEPIDISTLTLIDAKSQQMHLERISSDQVYFRAGKEVVVANTKKQAVFSEKEMATQGVFGVAMELILSDILPSGPAWSHWEGSAASPVAVFRYALPLKNSHYGVAITDDRGSSQPPVAYHGEIAIDPANGTILRLTAVADLNGNSPTSKGDVMVEYGPVEIGGKSYICPVRSVSLAIMRTVIAKTDFQNKFRSESTRAGPPVTKVNDVQFVQYHRFRSEARILTGEAGSAEPR